MCQSPKRVKRSAERSTKALKESVLDTTTYSIFATGQGDFLESTLWRTRDNEQRYDKTPTQRFLSIKSTTFADRLIALSTTKPKSLSRILLSKKTPPQDYSRKSSTETLQHTHTLPSTGNSKPQRKRHNYYPHSIPLISSEEFFRTSLSHRNQPQYHVSATSVHHPLLIRSIRAPPRKESLQSYHTLSTVLVQRKIAETEFSSRCWCRRW